MTTMLEKMARAIHEEQRMPGEELYDSLAEHQRDDWRNTARAAFEAIREPGECILQNFRHDPDWSPSMWPEGIDAILEEKTP